jgi:DNA-binding transcriptional ArsR family regulator
MNALAEQPGEQYADDPAALARKLNALAHPARLEILRHLAERDACCCKDVVGRMNLAQSTVSQHLRILVDAGIVRFATDRQRSRYEVDRRALADMARALNGVFDRCCAPAGGREAES